MSKMTQRERVLNYMRDFGDITPFQAFTDLGCTKLATRISELIDEGYQIKKDWVSSKNRYGEKVRFKKYSLEE